MELVVNPDQWVLFLAVEDWQRGGAETLPVKGEINDAEGISENNIEEIQHGEKKISSGTPRKL